MTAVSEASILTTVKVLLGIEETETAFDVSIVSSINTAFGVLHQLGVGPSTPYYITGDTETWGDFTTEFHLYLPVVTYVTQKTKLIFDPPAASFVLSALQETIKELESRLMTQNEVLSYVPPVVTDPEEGV